MPAGWDDDNIDAEPDYITNPYSSVNFNYGRPVYIDLPSFVTPFQHEVRTDSGRVISKQFTVGGMFAAGAYSNGRMTDAVRELQAYLKRCLVENYHELHIGESGQINTQLLLQSIENGLMDDEAQLDNYRFRFRLSDITRNRSWGPPVSTMTYGKYIMRGRKAITTDKRMVFPAYAGPAGITTGWIRTRYVHGVEPKDFTVLNPRQIDGIGQILLPRVFKSGVIVDV